MVAIFVALGGALGAAANSLSSWLSKKSDTNFDALRELIDESRKREQDCQSQIAALRGQVDELRNRIITADERFHAEMAAHRHLKHEALNALTIAEGTLTMAKQQMLNCSCGAFDILQPLLDSWKPRAVLLQEDNLHLNDAPRNYLFEDPSIQ